jgi:lysyl-tRNA synthetase class 2
VPDTPVPPDPIGRPADLPEQMQVRLEKLDRFRAQGVDPYPVRVNRSHTVDAIRRAHPDLEPDTATGDVVSIAGRVMLRRDAGKLAFATIRDVTGDLQVMLSVASVGEARLEAWKRDVDLGDHVSVTGEVITSRRGELSVLAGEWQLASKALRPLPDKWHGVTDPETRVRQRYVDLIVNDRARELVQARAAVLRALRGTLDGRGYIECETPVLQATNGGAAARPFLTHLNAFDVDMYLRIALELPLKRLVVGGLERVYEVGRTFRNEGVDTTHNPEFTMLEAYGAYGDYDTMADLTRTMIVNAAAAIGVSEIPGPGDVAIDLTGEWRSATLHDLVSDAVGEPVSVDTDAATLRRIAASRAVALQPGWDAGEIVLELFEKLVEHTLIEPTFVRDYPVSVRPLTRPHRDDPRLTEAWDLILAGVELGVAYSELIDPVEQRRRLVEQSVLAAGGDPEAMQLDEDFLTALEFGAPPMGGMGMGIDRLVMLLTGTNIREAITFPLLRPQ